MSARVRRDDIPTPASPVGYSHGSPRPTPAGARPTRRADAGTPTGHRWGFPFVDAFSLAHLSEEITGRPQSCGDASRLLLTHPPVLRENGERALDRHRTHDTMDVLGQFDELVTDRHPQIGQMMRDELLVGVDRVHRRLS